MDDVEASAANVAAPSEPLGVLDSSTDENSEWAVNSRVDPMTDAEILSASRAFQGQAARIRVAIRCSNHKNLYYLFTTVDSENGTPVSMSTAPNPAAAAAAFQVSGGLMLVQSVISYGVRVDELPARNGNAINPRRDNQLILDNSSKPLTSLELAKGSVLHIRLPVEGGSEVVEIDQTASGISEVIHDCTDGGKRMDADEANPAATFTTIGNCSKTVIKSLGTRLGGVPDSGSAVNYGNGVYGVSYDVIPELEESRIGDPIKLCLTDVPRNCPPGDDRGRSYAATNLRTGGKWELSDSQHECGGA
ncbi:hypothetical protein TomTYG75_09320 [Sphingobium sp. TomTYG75]